MEVPESHAQDAAELGKQIFVDVAGRYIKDVPFKADAKVGDRWGAVG